MRPHSDNRDARNERRRQRRKARVCVECGGPPLKRRGQLLRRCRFHTEQNNRLSSASHAKIRLL